MLWRLKVLASQTRDLKTTLAFIKDKNAEFMINSHEGWQRATELKNRVITPCDNIFLSNAECDNLLGIYEFTILKQNTNNYYKNKPINIYGPSETKKKFRLVSAAKSTEIINISEYNPRDSIDVNEMKIRPILTGNNELSYTTKYDQGNNENFTSLILFTNYCENIDTLLNNTHLSELYENKGKDKLGIVYHSTNSKILANPKYYELLERFGKNVYHILDCPEIIKNDCPRFAANQFTKAMYDCNNLIFPKLWDHSENPLEYAQFSPKIYEKIASEFSKRNLKFDVVKANSAYSLGLSDSIKNLKYEDKKSKNLKSAYIPISLVLQKSDSLKQLHTKYNEKNNRERFDNEPTIIMLGTGPTYPDKYRSKSAILMRFNKKESKSSILMDCGPGTYGQIIDHFIDKDKIKEILNEIKLILISHNHGDHINGLPKMLQEMYNARKSDNKLKEELYIAVPDNIKKWFINTLSLLSKDTPGFSDFSKNVSVILTQDINPYVWFQPNYTIEDVINIPKLSQQKVDKLLFDLKQRQNLKNFYSFISTHFPFSEIYSFHTVHSMASHGFVVKSRDYKIVYTSDTAPCKSLWNFGKGATLLIHECNYLASQFQKNAIELSTYHTSLYGLYKKVLPQVNPYRTIITHFSFSTKVAAGIIFEQKKAIMPAFDHMEFKLKDIEWMHKITPIINASIGQSKIDDTESI